MSRMDSDKNEIIEQLHTKAGGGDLSADREIVASYLKKSSELFTKEQLVEQMEHEAAAGNIYAMFTLSGWYRNGAYVEPDEDVANDYLQKIVISRWGKALFRELEAETEHTIISESVLWKDEHLVDMVGQACYQLGLFYLGQSTSPAAIYKTADFLKKAELCHYDCSSELTQLAKKAQDIEIEKPEWPYKNISLAGGATVGGAAAAGVLGILGSAISWLGMHHSKGKSESESSNLGKNSMGTEDMVNGYSKTSTSSEMKGNTTAVQAVPRIEANLGQYCAELYLRQKQQLVNQKRLALDGFCNDIRQSLRDKIRPDNWQKLTRESQQYLLTGMFCFTQMLYAGKDLYREMDFSAAISPVMKALELELKLRFFRRYLRYLTIHCQTVDKYLKLNQATLSGFPEEERKTVLKRERGKLVFLNYQSGYDGNRFTLGSLPYAIGLKELAHARPVPGHSVVRVEAVDRTMIDFCREDLLRREALGLGENVTNCSETASEPEQKIVLWLNEICAELIKLRCLRNDAAHGGKVMDVVSAKYCLNEVVVVQELLSKILSVCR